MRLMNIAPWKFLYLNPGKSEKFTEDLQKILGNQIQSGYEISAKSKPYTIPCDWKNGLFMRCLHLFL